MTLAQKNGITEFPYIIRDECGKLIYYEDSTGYWTEREFDSNGNLTYCENSDGNWLKRQYDSNGNLIRYESSNGLFYKKNIVEIIIIRIIDMIQKIFKKI
jgi:hypothetical protein